MAVPAGLPVRRPPIRAFRLKMIPALSIVTRYVRLRVPYVLSQFAVDAGPGRPWAALPRPGQGVGREGLEEKQPGRGMSARGGHGGYADVPGEVSEQVLCCDASERLQPTAEIVHRAPGVPHVVERAGVEAV